jgi:type I restriction enzyme R subunit
MNESETRAELVDPALAAAGWGVVEGSRIRREYQIAPGRIEGGARPRRPLIADYILEYRHTKLAVVEAKARDEEVSEGVGQAKEYAGKLATRFAYATNGRGIYAVDMRTGGEGVAARFPTPEELWGETNVTANRWRDRFAEVPFEDRGGSHPGRYYQDIAVERVLSAVAAGRDRILLTLATGTGKTFVAFQVAWKLFQSRWNLESRSGEGEPARRPRVLFLADRNVLADQAFNAFSAFPEDALVRIAPDEVRRRGAVPTNGSIFFTIFQTFMSGSGEDGQPQPYFGDYPADFFDFIVIDECHRGGANDESNWRGILEYFSPAVQLGLTATPKRRDNVDTYRYFGEPVYSYSLKEGINDGFLTPFRVQQISTNLEDYVYTSDDEVVEGEVEEGRRYEEKDFNSVIQIREREAHRVRVFMDLINQNEKTLVFCANQTHALVVRDLINQIKKSPDPNYCHRVTADDGILGDQHLRDFQDNEKTVPTVLTTSQKLSTGVDARNVRNIVLLRPVNSMIEFKQIVGRGTRLFDGKDYFTIYDFVKAHHHFSDPEWDGEPIDTTEEGAPSGKKKSEEGREPRPDPEPEAPPRKRLVIKLADGKERSLRHIVSTSFWSADGRPMSAAEFLEKLYGELPDLFKNEEELRAIWSLPDTRKKLLAQLAEKGFGPEQMREMQKIIDAEESDLFDVLAYVAFALAPVSRERRAEVAGSAVEKEFDDKQAEFLKFVLSQYVKSGVGELDQEKLAPLLRLRYHDAIADAVKDLGQPSVIGRIFGEFQRYLYRTEI